MKTWIKVLLVLIVLSIIGAALIYKFVYNKQHPDYENIEASFTMSAKDLYQEFKKNPYTSAKLYNGKIIAITGILSKVETADSLVTAVFVFKQGDFGDEGLRCTMMKKYNKEAIKLQPDGEVRIKGYCTGFNDTDVVLEKCSLIINNEN
ncbi:MAG: hypothetical protein WCP32_00930 [Bacteroidota bacterium]